MAGHPPQGHYDDGYGQHGNDAYYQQEGYDDQHYDQRGQHGGQGYYDEAGYYNADASNPYHQDGGYYEGNNGYQDDYYDNQYYEQNAAGQHYPQGQRPQRRGHDSEEDSETFLRLHHEVRHGSCC